MGFLTKIDMTNSTIRYLEFKEYWKTNVEKHLFRIAKEERFYLHIKKYFEGKTKNVKYKEDALANLFFTACDIFSLNNSNYLSFKKFGVGWSLKGSTAKCNLLFISLTVIVILLHECFDDCYTEIVIRYVYNKLKKTKIEQLWEELKYLLMNITH